MRAYRSGHLHACAQGPLQGDIFRGMKRREVGLESYSPHYYHLLVRSFKRLRNLNVAFRVIVKVCLSKYQNKLYFVLTFY